MANEKASPSPQELRYLKLLAKQYPTLQSVCTEIVNLQAILNLPKGTEHFMSDIHGEYEAFLHILNNSSGAIKLKVDELFAGSIPAAERASFATLIYYPERKLEIVKASEPDMADWYRVNINRLLEVCRLVSSKYTRSKVRKALPPEFEYIIDELLHTSYDNANKANKEMYYKNIISTIIEIDRADAFIVALSATIKRLIVDRLHIVGDIYDRGPRADRIMDLLMNHHSVDIQWGNHDIVWMGAASGCTACMAYVLNNSIAYNNLEMLETGYGINLRPLALFASEIYSTGDNTVYNPKMADGLAAKDVDLAAKMHKAIAIILFKLEGQIIARHPEFGMEDRRLLHRIDYEKGTVTIEGKEYPMRDTYFPTIDPADPYALTEDEAYLVQQLKASFQRSEKLQRHVRFLFSKGSLYKSFNFNLLYHGCIPMNEDGSFTQFQVGGQLLSGKAYLDYVEQVVREGYYAPEGSPARLYGQDFYWYLWCGRSSPVFGRKKMTTFERLFVEDKATWTEEKDPYYKHTQQKETCERILAEFGITGSFSHIINGHIPVKSKSGENPVKADGKLIVIDGGFCRAYQSQTGIAGYTLTYNSYGMRLISHEPFAGIEEAIQQNKDIYSTFVLSDQATQRIKVGETDVGAELKANIEDLRGLLAAYKSGLIPEHHKEKRK